MDSLFHWDNPKTASIIDVVCANDPEFGNGKIGEPDHSHNPDAGECYWAYNVGAAIDKVLSEQPE